ncbi:MAG: VWA domain-containing protein [Chloroflexi bacterium]|nr:VWA domain-containing protein [Chloroflexota bacterium]
MLHRRQGELKSRLHWSHPLWLLLALATLLLSPAAGLAQEEALTVEVASFTTDESSQAQAVVTVLASDGRPLAGLTAEQFQANLNGTTVPVSAVTRGVDSSLGIAVVLALDVSGSMAGGALTQAKTAAHRFLNDLAPQDTVAIVAFGNAVVPLLAFTTDRAAAGAAIDGLTASGSTALYDATVASIRLAVDSGNSRLAVVLLTDGVDDGSLLSRADALATAQTLGVPVFAIGLGTGIDRAYLQELAQGNGGRFAETPSPQGLAQLYAEAAELLRGQYILTLDTSEIALDESQAVTLRVDVTAGELTGGGERMFEPRGPFVTLSAVEPGERLESERTVIAQVVSNDPVSTVTFLVDGEAVLQLTEPPYQFTFDPALVTDGEHSLQATVVTTTGRTATSAAVLVRTGPPAAPSVTLSGVTSDEQLTEARTVTAEIESLDPISSVTFLVDGEPVLELTEPPYEFSFDPASSASGEHTLQVEVVTDAGLTATAAVAVRTSGGGSAVSPSLIAAGLIVVAGVGGALSVLYLLRRRRSEEGEPDPDAPQEPSPKPIRTGGWNKNPTPRPLWGDEPPPATPVLTNKPLGRLLITSGSLQGQAFPVSDAAASIGSGYRCFIKLPEKDGDEEIVPEWARVWVRDGKLMVHELQRLSTSGSMPGSWLILDSGESFTVGSWTFLFELDAAETVAAAEGSEQEQIPNILRDSYEQPSDEAPAESNDQGDSGSKPAEAAEPAA